MNLGPINIQIQPPNNIILHDGVRVLVFWRTFVHVSAGNQCRSATAMFDLTMAATSTSVYRTARRYERYATDLDGIFIVFFSYDAAFNPSSRETLGGYSMLSRLCI